MSTAGVAPAPRRRSVHFVPGGNERFLAKALAGAADTLVLDLEDSVPPDRKAAAREAVAEWLATVDAGTHELMVRINALDTPWGRADVEAVVPAAPASLMVPKVRDAGDLRQLDEVVAQVDGASRVAFFPVATETAQGVFHVPEVAAHPRVNGLCWGAEDLSAALGARAARDGRGVLLPVFEVVRSWSLLGAVSAGVQAVDSVYTDLGDLEGLRREAELAADMGFDGKITIHPDQVDVVNEAFTPAEHDVEEAAALLDAFRAGQSEGRLAFVFRGHMVDAPHLARAERLLARAGRAQAGGASA